MRNLWHHVKLFVVMCHADYWTNFERLRTKYKKKPKDGPGPKVAMTAFERMQAEQVWLREDRLRGQS